MSFHVICQPLSLLFSKPTDLNHIREKNKSQWRWRPLARSLGSRRPFWSPGAAGRVTPPWPGGVFAATA